MSGRCMSDVTYQCRESTGYPVDSLPNLVFMEPMFQAHLEHC